MGAYFGDGVSGMDTDNILKTMGHRPKKFMGQNFLKDKSIARRIVDTISVSDVDFLLEVGAGTGILTDFAVDLGLPILVIEKDPDLVIFLEKRYNGQDVEIVNGDIMNHLDTMGSRGNYFIYTNLPYNISSKFTGSIIDMVNFSETKSGFKGAVVMYQKEFAERLLAPFSSKKYGKISVTFQNKMEGKNILDVSRERFIPQPKVDSRVIRLKPRTDWEEIPVDHDIYKRVINRSFSSRRKKLKNLLTSGGLGIDVPGVGLRNILDENGWSDLRAENLYPLDFIILANKIHNITGK